MSERKDGAIALRHNEGKPQLGFILHFRHAAIYEARVLEYGGKKYAPLNWKKGGKPDSEYLDALMRHLMTWQNGEEFDPESGCNHLGHAKFNLDALIDLNYPNRAVDPELFEAALAKHRKTEE